MGNCPNCGAPLEANGLCMNCGFRLRYDPPAVTALKRHVSSPLVLALVICLGVRLILSLIPTLTYDLYGGSAWSFDIDFDAGIMLIAMLICYLDSRAPVGDKVNPRGFNIIRVYQVIMGVITAGVFFVFGVLIILFGESVTQGINYYLYSNFGIEIPSFVTLAIGIVFLLIAAFEALVIIMTYKTISAVRDVAISGAANTDMSMFIVVLCFIGGAANAVGILDADGIKNTALAAAEAASSMLAGIALLRMRNEMKAIKASFMPVI